MTDSPNLERGPASVTNAFAPGPASAPDAGPAPPGDNALRPPDPAVQAVREHIAVLTPAQRAMAARQAEIFTAIGQGLNGLAYEERRPVLAHMAADLVARGVPAAAIAGFDPTDANLKATMDSALAVRGLLAETPTKAP